MNPLLDKKYFIPDAEAHVMPDGRIYIYGSKDELNGYAYCSDSYMVFSTDDKNLENWTCHGISFENSKENPQVTWAPGMTLYAPDAIEKDGTYYLYACGPNGFESVAKSSSPSGPFENPVPVKGADGDGIDPAIFVDKDGSAYYFWGQFSLRGGKLKDDMATLEEDSIKTAILTEKEHGFHEGSSIRRRGDWYYLVYTDISRGKATCLSYAMSKNPLGPYEKGGVIIDNTYCDPSSWNNHGSIECFGDRWFVFYHRTTQNRDNKRRVCAEEIHFTEDGKILEAEMTSSGAAPALDAYRTLDASIACRLFGGLYIKTEERDNEMVEWVEDSGKRNWGKPWAEYKYLDFKEGAKTCKIRIKGKGSVVLSTENNVECGRVTIDSEDYESYSFDVSGLSGVKPIWFTFKAKDLIFLDFKFER